jgi:hypothetical protein
VVFADFACDALGEFGKFLTFRLADVLSRDLRPARPATVRRRRARMYTLMAVHGCLDCYAYLSCEAKIR